MISTAECAVDAQSLISMSLRKIHNSRTQRGGIKLHKNLLVSYVLRNARQVYMHEKYAEIYRMQQYEEVMTVCNEIQELDPLDLLDVDGEQVSGGVESQQQHLQHQQQQQEQIFYRSCCVEPYPPPSPTPCDFSPTHCNKTTVLDLDTHVVTTVENGCLHQDCCAPLQSCIIGSPAKKRKMQDYSSCSGGTGGNAGNLGGNCCYYELEDASAPCNKRAKLDECCSDCLDTANISNLISIFGSGFSGLVSRQSDLEQALNGQFCSKQALASLGAWTRAIVAF